MHRICAIIFLIFLAGPVCVSQNSYRFRHLGIENGLSQGSIYHMLKDSRGFLWLGSQDGINRFDGKNIQVYLSGATGESSNIQGIAEDMQGNLWIGSHKGIYKYIRKQNKFVRPGAGYSLGDRSVHVFSDRHQHIYLLSETGLYLVKKDTLVFITKELRYNRSQYNNFLAEASNGDFWLLDVKEGVKRYSMADRKISYFFTDHPENVYGKPAMFNCIRFDRGGNLWLGSKTGLMKFDPDKKVAKTFQQSFNSKPYSLLDIAEDQSGLLWLATEGVGILLFDPRKEKIVKQLQHEDDIPNSLGFNEVSKVFIDENNDIFANSDPQGLDIITAISSAFDFFTFGKEPTYNLNDYSVRGLAEDADSSIWIGTELGGVNRLDPKTGIITHYTIGEGLPSNTIRYILKDPKNRIWVSTVSGLALYNPKTNNFQRIELPSTAEITTILSVHAGMLLLSTTEGLLLFNTRRLKVADHAYRNLVGGYAAYMDPGTGLIYISNRHRGISVLKVENEKLVLKAKFLESFHVLKLDRVGSDPYLWACTDRGLIRWDIGLSKIVRNYKVGDGLHHEYIYAMLADEHGLFWLSTNRGLTKFAPKTEKFEFIKEIPPREYNSRASLKSRNGDLYFGGTTGLDRIKPKMLSIRNDEVEVHLTEIVYDDPKAETDSLYIGEREALQLPYSNNSFSLKFTATDFRSGGLNRYRYILKGYDQDTIYSGTVDQVRYARLPAGTYEFQLQASDLGGNWVSTVKKLKIDILPPFWQTWWFILLSLSLLISGTVLTTRNYLNRRLTAQRLESEKTIFLEKERSRIARDINDSLGSELFGLKLLGQVALSQTSREHADTYLQKIVEVSKSITEKISEVIWLTDTNQDNSESLWSYIQKNALIYLKPSGVTYRFDHLPPGLTSLISGERRHEILNFYKALFIELTRSCNSEVCEVIFKMSANHLIISIRNPVAVKMDESLHAHLVKLKGSRISNPENTEVLLIPLSD